MILDTSVVIKWFYEETETPQALSLFDRIATHDTQAIIPDLLYYEFANVLKTKGKAERPDIEAALDTLRELPWVVVEPSQHLLGHALEVADHYEISVYDAVYIALAFEWNAPLITADTRLVRAVVHPLVQSLSDDLK